MSTDHAEDDPTLYEPPDEAGEALDDRDNEEELQLEIPRELAEQLNEVAQHLGLSPAVVASRAIDFVCDEIGLVEQEDLTSGTLIQKYQTRLDLVHTLNFDVEQAVEREAQTDRRHEGGQRIPTDSDEEVGWEAVDQIIKAGEEAREP